MQLADRIRRMTAPHWLAFFGVILAAWSFAYVMQVPADLLAARDIYGADFWAALCTVQPGLAGAPKLLLMWVAMSAAMMAPTLFPALATFDDLPNTTRPDFARLIAGYFAVWLGFSIAATAAQITLTSLTLVDAMGISVSRWLNVGLLATAGAYQFSNLKHACLNKCRHPLTFFMQYWAEGPLRMGLRLGATCLGCCWALMALAFVGGTSSLLWMGAAMILMILEKMPDIGRHLTKPLGIGLLGAAALTAII